MMFIGLILAAAAAAATADIAYETTGDVTFKALHRTYTMGTGWAAIVAVCIGAVGVVGLSLMAVGMSRARRRRALIKERGRTVASVEDERDRLAAELERERTTRLAAERDRGGEVSGRARPAFDMKPAKESRAEPAKGKVPENSAEEKESQPTGG